MSDNKLVLDLSDGQLKEMPITEDEIVQREKDHEAFLAEKAKREKEKHIHDRLQDKDYPTPNEFIEALYKSALGEPDLLNALRARVDAVIAKYPEHK